MFSSRRNILLQEAIKHIDPFPTLERKMINDDVPKQKGLNQRIVNSIPFYPYRNMYHFYDADYFSFVSSFSRRSRKNCFTANTIKNRSQEVTA